MKDIFTLVYSKVKDFNYELGGYTDHKLYFSKLVDISIVDDNLALESKCDFIKITPDNILSVTFDYDECINIRTKEGALYELRKKID